MSWHPSDLVSDVDLLDYEGQILTQFGQTSWIGKRTKALEDWLLPILKAQGFDPYRLRTRYTCDKVWSFTGSTYTDRTQAVSDTTEDDLNLATVFTTVGTDALYIGSSQPFRGVFVRMLDSVGTASSVLSVAYWNGAWSNLLVADKTQATEGKTFSGGGSVTWLLPMDWEVRAVNSSNRLYWVKLTVSATPTSAKATQIGTIRASSLRAPATFRTLQLIFEEAQTASDGPWSQKAEFYKGESDTALQRCLQVIGGEFDTITEDELVDSTEQAQTSDEVATGWKLERA